MGHVGRGAPDAGRQGGLRWQVGIAAAAAVALFVLRIRGISDSFWLLRDQIRDWDAVLGSFRDLPLVGPATHVGGYTIGPAFYWILWSIRVVVGPWFDNLPHAGGIGQAALQSAVDGLLLIAIWRRTGSAWTAVAVIVLLATAAYDLSLAAVIWNPVVGSTLAKGAIALVLLGWHVGRTARVAATVAVAWAAVHAYTGAIYVAVGVLAAILLDPLVRRAWPELRRHAIIVAGVVLLLQLPYVAYQIRTDFQYAAMGAVSGSVGRVLSGGAPPEIAKSVAGLVTAFAYIQGLPYGIPSAGWILLAGALVVAWGYRHDVTMLAVTILPLLLALVGYALFLDQVEPYYYLSLMPSAVLMIVLALTTIFSGRPVRVVSIALVAAALALVPARARTAVTMHRMPEYRVLVRASRVLAARGTPMRAVRTAFPLPPTADPEFMFRILGGRIERTASWMATIDRDGNLSYEHLGG